MKHEEISYLSVDVRDRIQQSYFFNINGDSREINLPINIFPLDQFINCAGQPVYQPRTGTPIRVSPLLLAACNNLDGVLEELAKSSDVDDMPEMASVTALFLALCFGHAEASETLLKHGAKPDASFGCSALHAAARGGLKNVIIDLLENGVDPNVEDFDGMTPVFYALLLPEKQAINIIFLLQSYGAKGDIFVGDYNWGLAGLAFAMGKHTLFRWLTL